MHFHDFDHVAHVQTCHNNPAGLVNDRFVAVKLEHPPAVLDDKVVRFEIFN